MSIINTFFGKLIEWMILPFRGMTPWIGMAVISLVTGIFMLLIFRLTSNQKGIRQVKDKIKAHLMEIRLFKDNLGLSPEGPGKYPEKQLEIYQLFSQTHALHDHPPGSDSHTDESLVWIHPF